MSRKLPALLATLGLALAAAPASAQIEGLPTPSDPVARVPAGQVEHSVVVRKVEGSRAVPSHERHELWLGRTHARSVVTDLTTGKVRLEVTVKPGETRMFDPRTNRVTIMRGPTSSKGDAPPWNAAAFEATVQKAYVEQGYTRVVGEKVVDGRRALITESVAGKWRSDEPASVTTAVVDAETFMLYERTTEMPGGAFRQTELHEVNELLPAAATSTRARLAMAKHPGAKVRVLKRSRPRG